MKVVIDAKSFFEAVAWVTKSYDVRDDRAYVGLFLDESGSAHLSHANLGSYMKSEFTVVSADFSGDADSSVAFAVDGRYLQKLASALSSGDAITLSKKLSSERTSLDVATKSGKFAIPLFSSKIPAAPKVIPIGEVDDSDFFDSMQRVAKLCDPANTGSNSFFGAVDLGFDAENNTLKMFATDRYAMGEIVVDFSPESDGSSSETLKRFTDEHILLPHASAVMVPPTKGVNTSITLVGEDVDNGDARFGYCFPDGRLALFSLLSADKFTMIDALKKKANNSIEQSITVATSDLAKAIQSVSGLAWDDDDIFLNISKDGLAVTDSSSQNKLIVEYSEIDYTLEDERRVRFIRPVINKAFSPVHTTTVRLKWGPSSSAMLFVPVELNGDEVDTVFSLAVIGN